MKVTQITGIHCDFLIYEYKLDNELNPVSQTSLLMTRSFLILAVVKYFVFICVVTRLSKSIPKILSFLLAPNSDFPL